MATHGSPLVGREPEFTAVVRALERVAAPS